MIRYIILVVLLFISNNTTAAVLTYGNFIGPNPDSSETLTTFSPGGALAVGFVANLNYTLTAASFDISRTGGRDVRLRIYSGNTFNNSSRLYTSGNIDPAGINSITTFSGFSVSLLAGQSYWLVVDVNGGNMGGNVLFHSSAGNSLPTGIPNINMLGYRIYNENLNNFNNTTYAADYPNFSIQVPEPEEYALVAGLSLVAFAIYRKKNLDCIGKV